MHDRAEILTHNSDAGEWQGSRLNRRPPRQHGFRYRAALHQGDEGVEQAGRVVRAGGGLRGVLDGEEGFRRVGEALHTAVIQARVGHHAAGRPVPPSV